MARKSACVFDTAEGTATVTDPRTGSDTRGQLADLYQVIVFNDDVNTMDHVVMSLMKVFGHNTEIAVKIMIEAHAQGRAIAQVESRGEALRHKEQLQALEITAGIEPV